MFYLCFIYLQQIFQFYRQINKSNRFIIHYFNIFKIELRLMKYYH